MSAPKSLPTFTFDSAHGDIAEHMDGIARISGGIHKIRVTKDGDIQDESIELSLAKLGLGKGKVNF